mmetsp:Transcript_3250/g.2202  ORF Transcript_3250/g.2202 Transcript_3250/m.2202 type:complete len:121 (+) Transcript_3250:681-1043(+)
MEIIIRLAENGLIHGDFNEFNLMINDDEEITIIDFPQMTSTSHINGKYYFDRDVKCIQEYFSKRYGMVFEGKPELETDIDRKVDLDKEIKASGFLKNELGDSAAKDLEAAGQILLERTEE